MNSYRLHPSEYFMKNKKVHKKVECSIPFPPPLKLSFKTCRHKCENPTSHECCFCSRKPKCTWCQFKTWESLGEVTWLSFHGTSAEGANAILKEGFKQSPRGMFGPGVYVSADPAKAARFKKGPNGVVLVCLVKPGWTKKITAGSKTLQTTWNNQGYNSAYAPKGSLTSLEETCIFNPARVYAIAKTRY